MIKKDYLGDWSPDKDCCWRLTFRQPLLKPFSESSGSLSQLKFKKPDERFHWSIDSVGVGKCVLGLTVNTCTDIGYANTWIVKQIMHNVLLWYAGEK